MELQLHDDFHYIQKNPDLVFCEMTDVNKKDFENNGFVPISYLKSNYWGVYYKGFPAGFIGAIHRGKANYFNLKYADLYLQNIYVFPRFRGMEIAMDSIAYCIKDKKIKRGGQIILCVNPENLSAVRCYEKMGFRFIKKVRYIRFYKNLVFPRHRI